MLGSVFNKFAGPQANKSVLLWILQNFYKHLSWETSANGCFHTDKTEDTFATFISYNSTEKGSTQVFSTSTRISKLHIAHTKLKLKQISRSNKPPKIDEWMLKII